MVAEETAVDTDVGNGGGLCVPCHEMLVPLNRATKEVVNIIIHFPSCSNIPKTGSSFRPRTLRLPGGLFWKSSLCCFVRDRLIFFLLHWPYQLMVCNM